jgi:hypothetical protein
MIKFKFNYKPEGRSAETYRNVSVIGRYGSNDFNNLGMLVRVPERKYKMDEGIRRFSYERILGMEVEA